nr:MAG TPA: AAA domain protein [Caudoviricetes sp.]
MEGRGILMNITKGKIKSPLKVVLYGTEGIGKSTFASRFPSPLFIDTEDSTKNLDVARFDKPTSWSMLMQQIKYTKDNPDICKTLVIDTADWAEQLEIEDLCARKKWSGIEDAGYGRGYQYSAEEFGKMLNALNEVIAVGINVVVTAHACLRKVELPEEMGSFDHWEMKTSKKVAPMLREWADMVLFANYETIVVTTDSKKNKAQGSRRVMYTEHHACWDAKNRAGLAPKLPFDYAEIAAVIEGGAQTPVQPAVQTSVQPVAQTPEPKFEIIDEPAVQPELNVSPEHKKLADLMAANGVTVDEIRSIVAKRGYYPAGTPVENYDPAFVGGVLVGAWNQVFSAICATRNA